MANPIIISEPHKVINSFDSPWNASALPIQYTVSNDKYPIGAVVSNYYTEIVISVNAVVIATIQQLPDSNNETKIDVRKYVQSSLSFIPSTLFGTGIDTNASCFFSISGEEKYLDSGGAPQSNPIDNGGNVFYASNSALQFGEPNGGNMYDYVLDSTKLDLAKWMTSFQRGSIIDINNFTFSIIVNDPDFDLSVDQFDKNGLLLVNEIVNIPDSGAGVYRLSSSLFNINNDADYITVLATKGGIALTESLPIDVDLSCFIPFDAPSSLLVSSPLTAEGIERVDALQLDWVSNSNLQEIGFGIERSVDGITFTQIDTVAVGITTYINESLTYNDTWFYRVRALGTNPSGYSNIDSGTVATNPLIFDTDVHAGFKSEFYIVENPASSTGRISRWNDVSGNNRHIENSILGRMPYSSAEGSNSGDIDGHPYIFQFRSSGDDNNFLENLSNWSGLGTDDYFVIVVARKNSSGVGIGNNNIIFNRASASDNGLLSSAHQMITTVPASDGFPRYGLYAPLGSGAPRVVDRLTFRNEWSFDMIHIGDNPEGMWIDGVFNNNAISVAGTVTEDFDTVRFGSGRVGSISENRGQTAEVWFIKGKPSDYAQKVNDIHSIYGVAEYPSFSIVSPNL